MEASDILGVTREQFPDRQWPSAVEIQGGGSDRRYFRVEDEHGATQIVMFYTDARPDNAKFLVATRTLERIGVPVPRIHGGEKTDQLLWMDDLGDGTLLSHKGEPWKESLEHHYHKTLEAVAPLHHTRPEDLEEAEREALEPAFDEDLYRWEQDYFFDHFIGQFRNGDGAHLRENQGLRETIEFLAAEPRRLVHRDFQSQNVMLEPDRGVVLIDYQGLRAGLPEYDLASLLWDPYMGLGESERAAAVVFSRQVLGTSDDPNADRRLRLCLGQRLMQALGAYANLSINLGKPEFQVHMEPALASLIQVASEEPLLADLGELG